jgi:xanthine dehydrogenase YagS FAD-binding subunit
MRPLSYARAPTLHEAIAVVSADPAAAFLAGGTTEVDLVRAGVLHPDLLVDINALPLAKIDSLADGGVRVGALARMTDVARSRVIVDRYPAVSQALLLGASEQLRNMASIGGNLCQRVRCPYFRDTAAPCNRRAPGTGCSALEGINRGHAILGTSEHCIATHPSDLAVALVAFDAVVHTIGPDGEARETAIDDFYLLPGDAPHIEHPLDHGELIVAVELPPLRIARASLYLKLRDRQSYEFALVSVAAAMEVHDGRVADVRLALGGVGAKPWRALRAEEALIGAAATPERFAGAAAVELEAAQVRRGNAFKVELAQRAVVRALTRAMNGGAP